jgi:CRP/FNR family transcriptional regulator, cyclic AMP receptor protein
VWHLLANLAAGQSFWVTVIGRISDNSGGVLVVDSVETRLAILRRLPLLRGISDEAVAQLAASAHVVTAPRGQVLFVEGDPSDRLYVVLSGRIRIFRTGADGAELVLSYLTAGESIGELSVIDELPRSASASVVERARLITVPAGRMRDLLVGHPEAMLAVAKDLARTVRRLTGATADLVFLDLRQRVAKLLLDLQAAGSSDTVVLPASQGGVAAQLGVTRQSVNQTLRSLASQGLVAVDGRVVRVIAPDQLRALVGGNVTGTPQP